MCRLTERTLNGFWCYKIYQVSCTALQCYFILSYTLAPFTHRFTERNTDLLSFLFILFIYFYLFICLWKVIVLKNLNSVVHFSVVVVYSFSLVMSWTNDHGLILCREVANVDPYMANKSSTQRSSI